MILYELPPFQGAVCLGVGERKVVWPMDHEQIESLSFEDSYNLLDELIQKLEAGNMSIDESVALYEEGMKLAAHCERQLDDAEVKVTQLLSAAAGKLDQHAPHDD